MDKNYIRTSQRFFCAIFLMFILFSCANIGTPNGGPYDESPPKYVSSTPLPKQKNYKGQKVEIVFDELVQLDKPSENVIITPPQLDLPVIRTAGKKVVVELKDSLKPNTTYTVDFTNSLSDNNEKNVLENYSFSFSTGDVIDSLEIGGVVLNAENLEPMPGITVGIHRNLEDSAFVKLPFDRTSRTNDKGQFTIRNISPGSYKIYALNDVNRDYRFDQPGEDIAFLDSIVIPSAIASMRPDTVWKDSLTIDTIKQVGYTKYLPDNVNLMLFKETFSRQYMSKPERPDQRYFTLKFNAPMDTLPVIVPLNFQPNAHDSTWFVTQKNDDGLSINYWMTDSLIWQKDTLEMSVTYPMSDSLNVLQPQTDTLTLVMRHKAKAAPKKKDKDKDKVTVEPLGMQISASGSINIYDTISITFNEPVLGLRKESFLLEEKIDSTFNKVDFDFFPDTLNSLKYYIKRPWKYAQEFSLVVDSAVIESLYGKVNAPYTGDFKIKKDDEYGHLYLNVLGVDSNAYVELLSSSDVPIRKSKVKDGGALFMDLKPDKYYARLFIDSNNNGKWDPGNYKEKRHPEVVFYSPKLYEIPQNWQVEETWDVNSTPITKQKPIEITKNKPKEDTKKKRNYKDEGQKSSSGNSSSGRGGLPF